MTHTNSNPIWATLLNLKVECLNFRTLFQRWFHCGKFIARCILGFHMEIRDYFHIIMFVGIWELIYLVFLPDVSRVNLLLKILLIFLELWINLSNILWDHFVYIFIAWIQRWDQFWLCNINNLIRFLFVCRNHCNQFLHLWFQCFHIRSYLYWFKSCINLDFWIRILEFYLFTNRVIVANQRFFNGINIG